MNNINNIFLSISLAVSSAAVLGIFARILRQPVIISYIATGVAIGFLGVERIPSPEVLSLLAQLGIAFLLFMVGLELSLSNLREIGRPILLIAAAQMGATFVLGIIFSLFLGFSVIAGLYIGLALSFSSTIICIKLLIEKNEIDSLYGKMVVGVLLMQDFVAVLILMILSAFGSAVFDASFLVTILVTVLKGVGLILLASVLSKRVLPFVFERVAQNQELLFLSAIAWCFIFASLAQFLNFSLEIGAFLAGLSIASLPYRVQISAKIRPLRDFFVSIFFIVLGIQMMAGGSLDWGKIIVLSMFVIFIKPLTVLVSMGFLGYKKHLSFLTGATLGQISEFSLLLVAMGQRLGHFSSELTATITAAGVITILTSTYTTSYGQTLYHWFFPVLGLFERKKTRQEYNHLPKELSGHTILIGCDSAGSQILKFLKEKKDSKVVVVDFNPSVIKRAAGEGLSCLYGDISDPEVLENLNLGAAKLIISTVPIKEDNLFIIKEALREGSGAAIIATSLDSKEALELYEAGANYVILPYTLGGQYIAHLLSQHWVNPQFFLSLKNKTVKDLIETVKKR